MFLRALIRPVPCQSATTQTVRRSITTLAGNPHIYIHPDPVWPNHHVLSLLPTLPLHNSNNHNNHASPSSSSSPLTIGTTPTNPPTPASLTENPAFLTILHSVLADHAFQDASIISQAQALASIGGFNLGSSSSGGGVTGAGADGAGGASGQGGAGGGGRGGYIHVYDHRNPPDYGRIPFPEDIFGSLEVDAQGRFVDGKGRYQASGTYRVLTREGCLGLTPFLRDKLIQRLKSEEGQ